MKHLQWRNVRYSPITLGFGSHYVHMAQLKSTCNEIYLSAAETVPLPQASDRLRSICEAVRSGLATGKFKGRHAALCLKGDDLFVQHQRLSVESSKNVETQIREELKRNVPFDLDQAHLQFLSTGRIYEQNRFRDELILMIAMKDVVNLQLAALDKLRLQPCMIGVEPVGLLQTLVRFPPPEFTSSEVTGFMNIGASKTDLVVIREGRLAFTRSLPMGGEKFVQAIAAKLETDGKSSARLKSAISRKESVNETLKTAVLTATRPVIEELCNETLSCFRYYASIFNRESVQRLIIAGQEVGGLVDPQIIGQQLGLPVVSWRPDALKPDIQLSTLHPEFDSAFTSVVGVALESMESSGRSVDFLPRQVIERLKRRRSTLIRGSSLALLVLVMLVFGYVSKKRHQQLDRVCTMVHSRCELIDTMALAVKTLTDEIHSLESRRRVLERAGPPLRMSRIVAEISRVSEVGIYFRRFTIDPVKPMRKKKSTDDETDETGEEVVDFYSYLIQIDGLARSSEDLSDFVNRLASTGIFSSLFDEGFKDVVLRDQVLKSFSLTMTVGEGVRHETY